MLHEELADGVKSTISQDKCVQNDYGNGILALPVYRYFKSEYSGQGL